MVLLQDINKLVQLLSTITATMYDKKNTAFCK